MLNNKRQWLHAGNNWRSLSEIDAAIRCMTHEEKFEFLRVRMGLQKVKLVDESDYYKLIGEYIMAEIADPQAWDLAFEVEMITSGRE